jgi:hypothetical protein
MLLDEAAIAASLKTAVGLAGDASYPPSQCGSYSVSLPHRITFTPNSSPND